MTFPQPEAPFSILITNTILTSRTGTELVVRDLALALAALGHRPMVYSPRLGDVAREIRAAGVPVVSDLRDLAAEPDIIHGHHHAETLQALFQFPRARALFVCHDRNADHDIPPVHPRILRYVAVDLNCRERLAQTAGIAEARIEVILNWVDLERFLPRPALPTAPRRALVFSNYASKQTHLAPLVSACAKLGLPLDVAGSASGQLSQAPENLLEQYDLVFAKARCALEAMAVGAAVILCDARGLGSLVTSRDVARLRPWNFGQRLLKQPLEPRRIVREIKRYHAGDAADVSRFIRLDASLTGAVEKYCALYQNILKETPAGATGPAAEIGLYANAWLEKNRAQTEALIQYRQPYRTEPLLDVCLQALRLKLVQAPAQAVLGKVFKVQVELKNRSREKLGTYPPCPLNFSYRWLPLRGEEFIVTEGQRSPLLPALPKGKKAAYAVLVAPPPQAGRFRLRITLVQESVRWLDQMPEPVYVETEIPVGPA